MTSIIDNYTLIFWFLLINWVPSQVNAAFTFESCYDWGSSAKGNCTVVSRDGAVGAESANTIWIQNGYLDYGSYWYGCPYKYNSCPNGFSFYSWMKFKAYPQNCSDYGVVTSTEIFNVHLLGNGHLAVYVWLPSGMEYYAESAQPMALDIWYPIVVQFQQGRTKNSWMLSVYAQNQLVAIAYTGRSRTYLPHTSNLMFGGDGNGELSHNCSIQLDRTTFDTKVQDLAFIYQTLLNTYIRQAYCAGKYGIQPHSLTCYWVEPYPMNWTNAYSSCNKNAYTSGYPYSRLAQFPTWNSTIWSQVTKRLSAYGNGTYGYNAWIGGGHQFQWMDNSMNPIQPVVVPEGVTTIMDGSSNATCMQISTKTWPWQWSEGPCSTPQHYICEMSYDCFPKNPCKNFGTCQPINNGKNICSCLPGTSGQFCETGTPMPTCRNNCTNCTTSTIFKAPENCTNCLRMLQSSFNLLLQLEAKLKMQLISMSVDVEQAESWQMHILDDFYNFMKTLTSNFNVFDMPDCDMVWSSYAKMMVHEKIARKFISKIKVTSSNNITAELTTLWSTFNTSKEQLTNAKCFLDVSKNVQYSDGYSKLKEFFDDNYTADSTYLQKRFDVESKKGMNAMGFLYFGDMPNTGHGPIVKNETSNSHHQSSTMGNDTLTTQTVSNHADNINVTTPHAVMNETINLTLTTPHTLTNQTVNLTTPHAVSNQTANLTMTTPNPLSNETGNLTLTTLHTVTNQTVNLTTSHTVSNQTENVTLTTSHTISNQSGNLTLTTPHTVTNQTVNLTTPHAVSNQTANLTMTTPNLLSNETGNLTLTTLHTVTNQTVNLTTPHTVSNQTGNVTLTTSHTISNQSGNLTLTTPHTVTNQTVNLTTPHAVSNQTANLTMTTPNPLSNETGNLTLTTLHTVTNQTVNLTTPHTVSNQTGNVTLTTSHTVVNQTGNLTLTTSNTTPKPNLIVTTDHVHNNNNSADSSDDNNPTDSSDDQDQNQQGDGEEDSITH